MKKLTAIKRTKPRLGARQSYHFPERQNLYSQVDQARTPRDGTYCGRGPTSELGSRNEQQSIGGHTEKTKGRKKLEPKD